MIRWLKTAFVFILFGGMYLVVLILLITILAAVVDSDSKGGVYYNCTWAEISPDMPPKVKEECRKLTRQNIT